MSAWKLTPAKGDNRLPRLVIELNALADHCALTLVPPRDARMGTALVHRYWMEMRHIRWRVVPMVDVVRMSLMVAMDHKGQSMVLAHIDEAVRVGVQRRSTAESSPSEQRN